MRTSIEISRSQWARLRELAARRGERGYSQLVREAIDAYLAGVVGRASRVQRALGVLGSFDAEAAAALQASVGRARRTWR